jgi:LDH2 family malate/lactate/ureidoglycolate dehydrogenase
VFRSRVSDYAEAVRAARPAGTEPVRLPFDRSADTRRRILAQGAFEVPDNFVIALRGIAGEG